MASANLTSSLSQIQQLATEWFTPLSPYLAPLAPYNPQPIFERYYRSMEANYTEFEIATYGSLLVQIIFYFGTSFPGFLFQFISFMQKYRVQSKQHSLEEQWHCLKRVFIAKTTIYVRLYIYI